MKRSYPIFNSKFDITEVGLELTILDHLYKKISWERVNSIEIIQEKFWKYTIKPQYSITFYLAEGDFVRLNLNELKYRGEKAKSLISAITNICREKKINITRDEKRGVNFLNNEKWIQEHNQLNEFLEKMRDSRSIKGRKQ